MWYKTAKQGSVWSRIAPDAEELFDKLLDESTVTKNGKKTIDIQKLNEIFQKSSLSKLVLRFLEKNINPLYAGQYRSSKIPNIEILRLFQRFIPTFLANQIEIRKDNPLSYMGLRGTLKHEMSHAITKLTIPYRSKKELYVPYNILYSDMIGKDIAETNNLIFYFNIRSYCKKENSEIETFKNYLKTKLGDSIFSKFVSEKREIIDNYQIIKNIYEDFMKKVFENQIKIDNKEKNILINIGKTNFENIVQSFGPIEVYHKNLDESSRKKLIEKTHEELSKRALNLDSGVDLFSANPEETRAFFLEIQNLFSLRNFIEYYENFKESNGAVWKINFYLEYVKLIFNELLSDKENNEYNTAIIFTEYFDEPNAIKILNDKKYDYKFKEQLAKHFNNVYQQLKEYYKIQDQKPLQNLSQEQYSNVQDSNELINTEIIPNNKN